jgi:hypothetical protein
MTPKEDCAYNTIRLRLASQPPCPLSELLLSQFRGYGKDWLDKSSPEVPPFQFDWSVFADFSNSFRRSEY